MAERSDKRVRMRGISLIDRTYDIMKDEVGSSGPFELQDPIQNPLTKPRRIKFREGYLQGFEY